MARINTLGELRAIIGTPNELVPLKIQRTLNAGARAFVSQARMLFMATYGSDGMPQVSPKGDAAGFVQIEDPQTLLIPERKGNKLIYSLGNLLENPRVGLIFVVPGTGETLRVHGCATLDDDAALCQRLSARGSPALLVIRVRIRTCYFHCAKAFLRAELWKPENWPPPMEISFGDEISQRASLSREQVVEFDAAVRARYTIDL